VLEPGLRAVHAEGTTPEGSAILRHYPLGGDAHAGELGERPDEAGNGTLLKFAGRELGVVEPESIVEADVQVLPALAPGWSAPVAGDPMAHTVIRPSFLTSMWMSSPGCSFR
jgi:hypothetical protein